MKCLLKYQWVKLPRSSLPAGKGLMGYWAKLAAKAAFRSGKSKYCGHINEVVAGKWAGGIVGLKSILGIRSRERALFILDTLSYHGYIEYSLDEETKKLTYCIKDFVVKCSGEPCLDKGIVYASDGYGFLCLPRSITRQFADGGYTFEEADAYLDLWCNTVWREPLNIFSMAVPTVQFDKSGAALTLETLGQRWGWEKTKVWRFLKKYQDAFTLHKLPGSYGCLIFNIQYPTNQQFTIPTQKEIIRILDEIRITTLNTYSCVSDNERINKMILARSKNLSEKQQIADELEGLKNRVAVLTPITRAYFSLSSYKNCNNDCKSNNGILFSLGFHIPRLCRSP